MGEENNCNNVEMLKIDRNGVYVDFMVLVLVFIKIKKSVLHFLMINLIGKTITTDVATI